MLGTALYAWRGKIPSEPVFGYGSRFSRMRDSDCAETVALLHYRL